MPLKEHPLEEQNNLPKGHNPYFVIDTPNRHFNATRLGVEFRNGRGRTYSQEKARRFSEEFGYWVWVPPQVEKWEEVKEDRSAITAPPLPGEGDIILVDE